MKYLCLIFFVACLSAGCKEDKVQEPYKTGMEGQLLPDIVIQMADSVSYFHTAAATAGKPQLLFYYSPTCPYCRAQMRDMINHLEKWDDHQIYVVTNADLASMKKFTDYFKLSQQKGIIYGRDTGSVIAKKYHLMGVPFTATFDENKNLKAAYVGRLNAKSLLSIQ
ncbi:MAG: redoxin family protein [Candidatus Pseudobacter hemicellulosilyticus]|uniref:Redoxin family protein n=1 Tax=Candidatus Pseudobacter hemicellulosilyticus TaxID=3121375 RepID=A0AAJ5WTV9_9BACT|nr:MAG: redoxin family protein [Pseudobacter sp.]